MRCNNLEKIFIVDDDHSISFFYNQILTLNGFEVTGIAEDGEAAILMFESFSDKPKVILMDYRMPKKNGIEAMKEILQMDNKVKIIFTTADNSVKEEALSSGAFSFQNKPFTIAYIINEINRAIESYRSSENE